MWTTFYVLAAGKHDEARLWKEIERHVKFGEPATPISKFLGGHHKVLIEGGVSTFTTQMKDFLLDAAESSALNLELSGLRRLGCPILMTSLRRALGVPVCSRD